jgi:hypothetical protein
MNRLMDRLIIERAIRAGIAVGQIQNLPRARRPAKTGFRARQVMIGPTVFHRLLR